jgi:hypothetical protein
VKVVAADRYARAKSKIFTTEDTQGTGAKQTPGTVMVPGASFFEQ